MNKIEIHKNQLGEFYAVIKAKNNKIVWQTQSAGVTRKRTIYRAIELLSVKHTIVDKTI